MDTRRFEVVSENHVPAPVLDVAHATLRAAKRILGIAAPPLVWVRQSPTGPRGRFEYSTGGRRHRIVLAVPPDVTPRSLAIVMGVTLHEFRHFWQAVSRWSMSEREQPAQEADAVQWSEKIAEALVQILQNEDPTATIAEIRRMI